MAECGFLERLFPELQEIDRRAAPDPFRRHAASLHAVLPVRRIELLRNPEETCPREIRRPAGGAAGARAPHARVAPARCRHAARPRPRAREPAPRAAGNRLPSAGACGRGNAPLPRSAHHRQMARVAFQAGCREPGCRRPLRDARRERRASEDVVSRHAHRHRSGEPRGADAMEGRFDCGVCTSIRAFGSPWAPRAVPGSTMPVLLSRWPGGLTTFQTRSSRAS